MTMYIDRVWDVIELFGIFSCTWPDKGVSKRRFILRNIYWIVTFFNTIWMVTSLILGLCNIHGDVNTLIETSTEVGCITELIVDLILYKKYSEQLQILVQKVKTYARNANEYETSIMQGYIERYKTQFLVIVFQYISAGTLFSVLAMCSSKDFPFSTWLPFSLERKEIYYFIFFVESFTIIQIAFSIFSDFVIVIFITYTSARLDILGSEMKQVSDYDMLIKCIKEHQEIIGFFEDTTSTVRPLLFKTNIAMGGAVIGAVLCLLYAKDESVVKAFTYLSTACAACGHIFIITWPADDLRESCLKFAKSVYDIPWLGKSPKISSAICIMMSRCQRPFLITLGGIFPVPSLQFFSQFLANVFSYFMAMRSVLE